MAPATASLLSQALQLPATERAALVDELIGSLDKPDPTLDALWLREAQSRLAAYRAGDLEAIDAEIVFEELGKRRGASESSGLASASEDLPG